MLILSLAWRALLRDRFFLLCNVAVMVGILVPLLVLLGVKNGVYQALVGEMLADPANLQIDTAGNATLTEGEIAPLRGWPEIAFLTPKVRGQPPLPQDIEHMIAHRSTVLGPCVAAATGPTGQGLLRRDTVRHCVQNLDGSRDARAGGHAWVT